MNQLSLPFEKEKSFRTFVQEMWYKNQEELEAYHLEPYTPQQYFQKYKWWLRNQFRNS